MAKRINTEFADGLGPVESRQARATRLRPLVARWVAVRGARYVAGVTALCHRSVDCFARGKVVPVASALDAYEALVAAGDPEPPARRITTGTILVSGGW